MLWEPASPSHIITGRGSEPDPVISLQPAISIVFFCKKRKKIQDATPTTLKLHRVFAKNAKNP